MRTPFFAAFSLIAAVTSFLTVCSEIPSTDGDPLTQDTCNLSNAYATSLTNQVLLNSTPCKASSFSPVQGLAVSISKQKVLGGLPWVVDATGNVWRMVSGTGWVAVPGIVAQDIGVGKTTVYATGTDNKIYKISGTVENPGAWTTVQGLAARIDVGYDDVPWVATSEGMIWRLTQSDSWVGVSGISAQDIGCGGGPSTNGTIGHFAVSEGSVYEYKNQWESISTGSASRLCVDEFNSVWATTVNGSLTKMGPQDNYAPATAGTGFNFLDIAVHD